METFSAVVRYDLLRALIALVARDDPEMTSFDVRTTFLHGELEEEIYMEVLDGVTVDEANSEASTSVRASETAKENANMNVVCRLLKSLYGLKQAPRYWNQRFKRFLGKFNFIECGADQCIFVSQYDGEIVYLALFVDDGLVCCKSTAVIASIIDLLNAEFEVTVGDAQYFVGLQISQD